MNNIIRISPKRICLIAGYILLMAPTVFMEAVAGSFPVDLHGTAPEQASLTLNVYKPADAVNGMLTLSAHDADAPREGALVINGHSSIRLFNSLGVPENDKRLVNITISTPASYWKDGNNKLTFYHLRSGGYSINEVTVSFDGASTPDPEPVATFSLDRIDFGSQDVGGISRPLALTLTNSGTAPLNISGITVPANFVETNNCSDSVPAGGNCIFDIQFVPATSGDISGKFKIASDAVNSSDFVRLTGTGTGGEQTYIPPSPVSTNSPGIVFYNDLNNETRHTYTKTDLKEFWGIKYPPKLRGAVDIVADPDPRGTHNNALRVFYAADNYGKRGGSGAQWKTKLPRHDELYFSYDVYFEPDAEFVKGGKLPRLQSTGWDAYPGVPADGTDRWTAGLMWQKDGRLASYVYHANMSGNYGTTRLWNNGAGGQVYLKPGQWHSIEVRVVMNTPGVLNGRMQGWFDGKLAFDSNEFMWRMPGGKGLDIGEMQFTTFYGGGNSTFAPSTDQHIYFDNFIVSTQPITH